MERKVPKRRIEKIVISGNVIEYYRYQKPLNVEPREHDIEKNRETSEAKETVTYIERVLTCAVRYGAIQQIILSL